MFYATADSIRFLTSHPCNLCSGSGTQKIPMAAVSSIALKGDRVPQHVRGIRELTQSGRYKVWLLDQFGVLHDGKKPYPGAKNACNFVERLADVDAKVVIVSNSSRRACTTLEKMEKLGFNSTLFVGAITSGELTHQYLLRKDDPWFAKLGRQCIHMTWSDRGAISLEGLGLQIVENVEEADFILAHGTEAIGLANGTTRPVDLEDMEKILVSAIVKRLPMVVANPDQVTVEERDLRVMPGTLGSKYEAIGGDVRWMGKPDQVIYNAVKQMTGASIEECIAVGDSLQHDILGANKSGIKSVFISSGIHAKELGINQIAEDPDFAALEALSHRYGAYPTYNLSSFTW